MNDCLPTFEQYKFIKEIDDLIDEIRKLREYYFTKQYNKMQEHINMVASKYSIETSVWNRSHRTIPVTAQQAYLNAEDFLRANGMLILFKNGVKLQGQFSSEDLTFLNP